MSKKIEDILFECLEDIKAGRADIAHCLSRYRSMRNELEPLLKIATSIQEPSDMRPSQEFKVNARASLMDHIRTAEVARRPSHAAPFITVKRNTYPIRLRTATVALAVFASIFGLGGGLAYASQDSLPGDNLYSVKLATEQFRRALTTDDVAEVKLELAFADTRLGEIGAVVYRGYSDLNKAVTGYERNITLALENVENMGSGSNAANALEIVALAISRHVEALDSIEDAAVGEDATYGVQEAREVAFLGYFRVARDLAAQDAVRAAEINLSMMESRLNRAQNRVEQNQIAEAEAALRQFEELSGLGEEISQITEGKGNGSSTIDELNARATSRHLELLGAIYGKMPDETKGSVEEAIAASVETYDQAVEGLQQQGALDDIPGEPPIPEEIPEDVKGRILKPGEPPVSNGGSSGSGNGRR